ncbi:MAG: hypothetical protein Q7R78_00825 [bacterium]|nr:hypothetical protein [bacterium]
MDTKEIEKQISNIKERNNRVEIDKAWEKSWTRRITIMILTYIIASIWLIIIEENNILLKAVIPTLGYLLSTLSIPQIKKIWITSEK